MNGIVTVLDRKSVKIKKLSHNIILRWCHNLTYVCKCSDHFNTEEDKIQKLFKNPYMKDCIENFGKIIFSGPRLEFLGCGGRD